MARRRVNRPSLPPRSTGGALQIADVGQAGDGDCGCSNGPLRQDQLSPLDRRLRFNLAVFDVKYGNLQLNTSGANLLPPINAGVLLVNAGDAKYRGKTRLSSRPEANVQALTATTTAGS